MNSCNFVGNLVNDPIFYEGETPRVLFTLAIDHNGKPVEGKKNAEFLDFVAWRGTAEFIAKYCHKGDVLAIQNAMAKKREIINDSGEKSYRTEFQADVVDLIRRKNIVED